MKRALFFIICILILPVCLLSQTACGGPVEAEPSEPEPPVTEVLTDTLTPAPTVAPTATPEPVVFLHVAEPSDAETLASRIAGAGTIETVEIDRGMLSNADIAALLAAFPNVEFRYEARLGDAFVSSDVTELSASEAPVSAIADALPCLRSLTAVHLGACAPETIRTAKELLPGIDLTYSVLIYGKEIDRDAASIDLSDVGSLSPDELSAAIPVLPNLSAVALGTRDDFEAVKAFCAANPSLGYTYDCRFDFLGQTVSTGAETLDFSGTAVKDLNAFRETIQKLPALRRIEMIGCGLDDETMGKLAEEFPTIKFVWEIDLGYWGKVRTDATAYSTRSRKTDIQMKRRLTNETVQPLRYCTDLVALDLGHQNISDLSFLRPLKKLKVVILADNRISDIGVLGELPELEYIEMFMNRITDVSPLANLANLHDLNICSNKVSDFTPLCSIKTLERLWYARNEYSKRDHQMLKEALPDCVLNYTVKDGTGDGWRKYPNGETSEREKWKNAFFEGAPRFE